MALENRIFAPNLGKLKNLCMLKNGGEAAEKNCTYFNYRTNRTEWFAGPDRTRKKFRSASTLEREHPINLFSLLKFGTPSKKILVALLGHAIF